MVFPRRRHQLVCQHWHLLHPQHDCRLEFAMRKGLDLTASAIFLANIRCEQFMSDPLRVAAGAEDRRGVCAESAACECGASEWSRSVDHWG